MIFPFYCLSVLPFLFITFMISITYITSLVTLLFISLFTSQRFMAKTQTKMDPLFRNHKIALHFRTNARFSFVKLPADSQRLQPVRTPDTAVTSPLYSAQVT